MRAINRPAGGVRRAWVGLPFNPKHLRKFLIKVSDDISSNNPTLDEIFRIPDEYVPIMREHYRKMVQMSPDDPLLQEVCTQVDSPDEVNYWLHALTQFNVEGLLNAANLCEFMLQGIKYADVLLEKPLRLVEEWLDDCEKYVLMREAMGALTLVVNEGDNADESPDDDMQSLFEEYKSEFEAANAAWKQEFGRPFTDEWMIKFSSFKVCIIQFGGAPVMGPLQERFTALADRDDVVDDQTLPWIAKMKVRQEEHDRTRRIKEAEDRRLQKIADRQAKREARAQREAEIARLQAEEERVARTKQPPLHPDLADAIEMVNIIDASDRVAALRDLRETALAVTLENPQDRQAEHWASWAKEQMKLARQPDTEWSVIDGQFRTARPEPPPAGRGD